MAGDQGFEPWDDGVKVRCLTAWLIPNVDQCRREDLNPQPTDYKSVALPVELQRLIVLIRAPHGMIEVWRLTGSNRRPSACKADALPAELSLHKIGDP
jgi:hypothetical protein